MRRRPLGPSQGDRPSPCFVGATGAGRACKKTSAPPPCRRRRRDGGRILEDRLGLLEEAGVAHDLPATDPLSRWPIPAVHPFQDRILSRRSRRPPLGHERLAFLEAIPDDSPQIVATKEESKRDQVVGAPAQEKRRREEGGAADDAAHWLLLAVIVDVVEVEVHDYHLATEHGNVAVLRHDGLNQAALLHVHQLEVRFERRAHALDLLFRQELHCHGYDVRADRRALPPLLLGVGVVRSLATSEYRRELCLRFFAVALALFIDALLRGVAAAVEDANERDTKRHSSVNELGEVQEHRIDGHRRLRMILVSSIGGAHSPVQRT